MMRVFSLKYLCEISVACERGREKRHKRRVAVKRDVAKKRKRERKKERKRVVKMR